MKKSFTFFAISALFLMLLFPVSVKADPCSNNLTIQCEDETIYRINSSLLTKGTPTPTYGTSHSHYSGADGDYVDFKGTAGEHYYMVHLPAATYSFTVYKAHAGNSWLNIWEADLGGELTYDGVNYGKHHDDGYDIKGDDDGSQGKPIHNSTVSDITLTEGDYIIGLYGNEWAAFDKIVIVADDEVFCEPACTKHTVTLTAGANGSVSGGGEQCDGSVTVTATPNSGYRFVNWTNTSTSAEVSTDAAYTFDLSADISLTANFEVNPCTDTKLVEAEDYIDGFSAYHFPNGSPYTESDASLSNGKCFCFNGDEYKDGEINFYVYLPAATYSIEIKHSNGQDKYLNIYSEDPDGDVTYNTVKYKKMDAYNPELGDNWCDDWRTFTYNNVVLTTDGYYLIGLYGKQYAKFDYIKFTANTGVFCPNTITMQKNGDASAADPTSSPANAAMAGTEVTITAGEASANHYFSGWTVLPENAVSFANQTNATTTFVMPAEDVTITANYTTCTQRAVTVVADDDEHGSVDGGGDYCEGASVTVTATPNSGYRFVNWTNTSSEVVSTDAEYTFTLSANISLTANFVVETRTNSLTIQCEDYVHYYAKPTGSSYDYPSAIIKNDYSEGRGPAQAGYFADFQKSSGEMWIPISLPVGTYTFTLRYSNVYSNATRFNLYSVSSGTSVLTSNVPDQDGNAYGEHTTDSYTVATAGEFVIGLYASGTYADFDQIVINATSNVFYPRYAITLAHGYGGSNYPLANVLLAEEGQTVTLTRAAAKSEFSFTGWSASPSVEFVDASAESTTFTMPAEAVTITANYNTYSRTGAPAIQNGNYGTICLPLDGTVTGATLYSVAGSLEEGGKLYIVLKEEESLGAGKPYIFQLSADELSVALSGTYTDLQDGNGLVGTYTGINQLDQYAAEGPHNYVLWSNSFKKVGENISVGAYRAYLNFDAISAAPSPAPGAQYVRMAIEGTDIQTGIETVNGEWVNGENAKILRGGHLFILRDGKTYNAQGQMIK